MAAKPETTRRREPATSGRPRRRHAGDLAGQQLPEPRRAPAPAMTGVAIRKQNRAAASRRQPQAEPGADGDPRPADPRDQRERLGARRSRTRRRSPSRSSSSVLPAEAVGQPQDRGADDEHERDEERLADLLARRSR